MEVWSGVHHTIGLTSKTRMTETVLLALMKVTELTSREELMEPTPVAATHQTQQSHVIWTIDKYIPPHHQLPY